MAPATTEDRDPFRQVRGALGERRHRAHGLEPEIGRDVGGERAGDRAPADGQAQFRDLVGLPVQHFAQARVERELRVAARAARARTTDCRLW